MKRSHLAKQVACGLAVFMLLIVWAGTASAQVLYVTALSSSQIDSVDTSNPTLPPAVVFNTSGTPDSLMFDNNGNIIYTNLTGGQVRLYNTTTFSETVIATLPGSDLADVALEPGGGSMLVSDFGLPGGMGAIYRINLNPPQPPVLLHSFPARGPQGLAFDNHGNLFAVLGTRGSSATSYVAQLNPVTGAPLPGQQTILEINLDGLTYDAFSGMLYAGSGPAPGAGIYKIDPANLSSPPILLSNSDKDPLTGVAVTFDGITTDSAGNLYAANPGITGRVYQYNLGTQLLTAKNSVPGLDDLAPLTGLGAKSGYIEICKQSDPEHPVTGSFNFTVANGGFNQGPISVPVGQCSGSIQVPSGAVTVTETPVSGVAVSSVTAIAYDELGFQQNELMSWTQPNLNATVGVMPGDQDEETIATFTNYTADPGLLKICKVAGDDSTLGVPFTFTASVNGQPTTYTINAGPASQGGNCVVAGSFPVSTPVTITETPTQGYSLTTVAVNEGQLQSCQPPSRSCVVATTIPGITEVTFTNNRRKKTRKH